MQMRQFRDLLVYDSELPVQPTTPLSGSSGAHGHSRGESQPSNNFHNLHQLQMTPSRTSSPQIQALSTEAQSTPDLCPTPNPPLSPAVMGTAQAAFAAKEEGDAVTVSHEDLDGEFNQFDLGLENSSLQERGTCLFDEFLVLDDFATFYLR
ncbi:uncharacterized protein N7458_004708 [Penicillium daleae]|uniref:Uncharacterized protein n=1 Tax=Penicillium daleae TaxID=63821 RepID=A0AAD6C6L1_9EURO|nr:uncharacterized protein N7458_004708 [Penicillium daleae]KAJ5453752.1 hypothetical protein N7458_004708 [Penicillium daleae]